MPEAPTPAVSSTAPTPPAPATVSEVAPRIDPRDAGKALALRRAEIRANLLKEPSAADPKGATPAPAPSSASPAGIPAGAPSGSPAEPGADDDLARLIQEDRRLKTAARELDERAAKVKRLEDVAPIIEKAQAHLTKGDRVAAAREIFGDQGLEDLTRDLMHLRMDQAVKPEGEVDLDKMLEAKLAAREREAQERRDREEAERRRQAEQGEVQRLAEVDKTVQQPGFVAALRTIPTLEGQDKKGPPLETIEAYGKYVVAVTRAYAANSAQYRAIELYGVWPIDVARKAEQLRNDGRDRPPTPAEVLKAIDDDLRARAQQLGGGTPPAAALARPAPTLSDDWRGSEGRPEPVVAEPKTLEEKRAARKAKLRGDGRAA